MASLDINNNEVANTDATLSILVNPPIVALGRAVNVDENANAFTAIATVTITASAGLNKLYALDGLIDYSEINPSYKINII